MHTTGFSLSLTHTHTHTNLLYAASILDDKANDDATEAVGDNGDQRFPAPAVQEPVYKGVRMRVGIIIETIPGGHDMSIYRLNS